MITLPADKYYSYKDMMIMTGLTRKGLEKRAKKLHIQGYRIAPECLMFSESEMVAITKNSSN